ncbi:MAG: PH domain-containing protein [Clostridiales bacterium]|nr:PH domain-containing protein [Clostridiales bacterium]
MTGYILGVIVAIPGVLFLFFLPPMGLLMIGVAVWGISLRYIVYKYEYLELTDSSVICHKGFFNSKTFSTPLSKIQSIGLERTFWDKMQGWHTIKIDTAGTGGIEFVFTQMGNAEKFVSLVQQQIDRIQYR